MTMISFSYLVAYTCPKHASFYDAIWISKSQPIVCYVNYWLFFAPCDPYPCIVLVIVISRLLKRYLEAKRTRAPAYSRALRRIKGGLPKGVKRSLGPISRVSGGDTTGVRLSETNMDKAGLLICKYQMGQKLPVPHWVNGPYTWHVLVN